MYPKVHFSFPQVKTNNNNIYIKDRTGKACENFIPGEDYTFFIVENYFDHIIKPV